MSNKKYRVLKPFTTKINDIMKNLVKDEEFKENEINPLVLKWALETKRVMDLSVKKIKSTKKDSVSKVDKKKKKVVRSMEDFNEVEKKTPLTGAIELNKESLEKKSDSELKRIATQLGIKAEGPKKFLIGRILKSGI